jgi:hypothetical protein
MCVPPTSHAQSLAATIFRIGAGRGVADQFGKNAYSTPIPSHPPVCVPLPLAFAAKLIPPAVMLLPTLKLDPSQAITVGGGPNSEGNLSENVGVI